MKESLKVRVENLLCRLVGRVDMLQESIDQYKVSGDFESAMKCDIKMRTLKLVEDDVRKLLQE